MELRIDGKPPMTLQEINEYFASLPPIQGYLPPNTALPTFEEFVEDWGLVSMAYDGYGQKWISVHDTYRLANFYYPNKTFADVIAIYKQAYNNDLLFGHICRDISRCVLRIDCPSWSLCDTDSKNEFGHTLESLFNLI